MENVSKNVSLLAYTITPRTLVVLSNCAITRVTTIYGLPENSFIFFFEVFVSYGLHLSKL